MKRILHSAIDKVYNWRNLEAASAKVIGNRGSGGIDGMSVSKWKAKEAEHLSSLRGSLIADRYRSKPVNRVYIPKPGSSKKRPLGIPIVRDRVCQQAATNVLSPVFEEYFHEDSHAFRPGRSTHTAAARVEELRREGYRHVVDLDIKGFFDHVDHEILMKLAGRVVKDRRVLGLIRGWLKAGVMEEGNIRYQVSGTPQGGVISPLLSNIYLTVLDNALEEAGYKFVRYADDVLILCRSLEAAVEALEFARRTLLKLKLELSEEKTTVTSFKEGFDFLGFRFGSRSRGIGSKSLKGFYNKVREITCRIQADRPVRDIVELLTPVLRGWGNYHCRGRNVGMFTKLDKWVRNRIRSYKTKHWRPQHGWGAQGLSREELEQMGLFSLRDMLRPRNLQLKLL